MLNMRLELKVKIMDSLKLRLRSNNELNLLDNSQF